ILSPAFGPSGISRDSKNRIALVESFMPTIPPKERTVKTHNSPPRSRTLLQKGALGPDQSSSQPSEQT
ncbi:hypothetical protein, partial [Profundibacter sp.]